MVKRSSIIDKVFWQFNLLWLWILNPRTQDNAVYASSYVLSVMGAVFVLQVFNVPQSIFFFIPSMLFTEFVIGKTYWERTRSVWVGGCTVAVFTFCATLVPPVPVITLTAGFFLAFICYYLSIFGMKGSIYGAFSVIFSILGLGMSGG
ncbi:MAG: hypothetical protein EBX40_06960, partial [Gammaproteobacteria bacterium]|nr:hypothetical protein [Gammaproteobacteria bacterium]